MLHRQTPSRFVNRHKKIVVKNMRHNHHQNKRFSSNILPKLTKVDHRLGQDNNKLSKHTLHRAKVIRKLCHNRFLILLIRSDASHHHSPSI
jgi:hypothetical protein